MERSARIQILPARDGTGPAGRAVAIARECADVVAEIARAQEAEALLLCPAPPEYVSEGLTLVIAARFAPELDEDAVFWRQRALATKIFHALRIDAMVLDLDAPMGAFLNYMQPMLAAPYVDEIGRREGRLPQA
jgi:hypothetical protein